MGTKPGYVNRIGSHLMFFREHSQLASIQVFEHYSSLSKLSYRSVFSPLHSPPLQFPPTHSLYSYRANHHQRNRTLSYFCYTQSIPSFIFQVSIIILDHHMPRYLPSSLQHPPKRTPPQHTVFLLVQTPPKIGPSPPISRNYYICTRLPQILAELCRKPGSMMSRFPMMYRMAHS